MDHSKYSSSEADSELIAKAQALDTHLSRCIEARNLRDWNTLLREARCAISSGADSAPQVSQHRPIPLFYISTMITCPILLTWFILICPHKKQIYALQAEALLKLHRHQEAYATFREVSKFQIDSCTQFFGPAACAYLLIIQAQLYMTMGRLVETFLI